MNGKHVLVIEVMDQVAQYVQKRKINNGKVSFLECQIKNHENSISSKEMYETLSKSALKHSVLYHYTSLESLKMILANQSFRLSCLTEVNDPKEDQRITSLWNGKIFVGCFTNTLKNTDYFFENYNIVRITFLNKFSNTEVFFDSELQKKVTNFHRDYNSLSNTKRKSHESIEDWCLFDVSFADVYYTEDLSLHISKEGNEKNAGLIKPKIGKDYNEVCRDWSIECESRLRVAVRPIALEFKHNGKVFEYFKPPFKYLYVPVKGLIKNIELCERCDSRQVDEFNKIVGDSQMI